MADRVQSHSGSNYVPEKKGRTSKSRTPKISYLSYNIVTLILRYYYYCCLVLKRSSEVRWPAYCLASTPTSGRIHSLCFDTRHALFCTTTRSRSAGRRYSEVAALGARGTTRKRLVRRASRGRNLHPPRRLTVNDVCCCM